MADQPDQEIQTITKTSVWHCIAWVAGALALLVPFIDLWEFGPVGAEFKLRQGGGYFGYNMMIGVALGGLGAALAGYWWRYINWVSGRTTVGHRVVSVLLLGVAASGLIDSLNRGYFFYAVTAVLAASFVIAWKTREKKDEWWPSRQGVAAWFKEPARINSMYFLFLFMAFFINNAFTIFTLESSFIEKLSSLAGRALFYGGFVCFFALLAELVLRATPKLIRPIPWMFLGAIPVAALADVWAPLTLNRPISEVVNGLTSSGEFDLQKELNAGLQGGGYTQFQCSLIVVGVVLLALLVAFLTWRVSVKSKFRVSAWALFITFIGMTGLSIAEKGIGSFWKNLGYRQLVAKKMTIDLGLFNPPKGVGTYEVEFENPPAMKVTEGTAVKRPDIYVIMVESMRGDALRKDVTPFLVDFLESECQPIATGCSGSNATHLSWYSMMHSQVPVFWRKDLEAIPDRNKFKGARPLQWMKNSGYNIEVRAVCDLGYKDFGLLNFGAGNELASVVEQANEGSPLNEMDTPRREVAIFNNLKRSIKSREAGGNFYFTALDSPHYGYYWHDDFKPPFGDYVASASFPVMPSKEVVKLYKQRYWNACAWVDHQVKEFVEFLKEEGRYDESIIIVTGDHGEEFQERGGWCHCSSVFPEQVEVPMLIKWPKSMGRGPAVAHASHLDVMPSLLSYMGAPQDVLDSLVGVNLLEKKPEPHTIITTTAYAGGNGETMVMRRGDYAAFFSWPKYWLAEVPEQMALERIEFNGKRVDCKDEREYSEKLREIFDDTSGRFFKSLELVPSEG